MVRIFICMMLLMGCSHGTERSDSGSIELANIDKGISFHDFSSLLKSPLQTYPLRYYDYVDSLYSRTVIAQEKMDTEDIRLTYYGLTVEYADLYFFEGQLIGFKITQDDNSDALEKLFLKTKGTQPVLLSKTSKKVAEAYIEQKKYKEQDTERYAMSYYLTPAMSPEDINHNWVVYLEKRHIPELIEGILVDEFEYLTLFRAEKSWPTRENPKDIYESSIRFYDSIIINKE